MQVAVPNTCPSPRSLGETASISVLPQGFGNPALGEFVLAHDALGVDPQEDVHAVPGPFRHLGRVDAAVEPRGQAGVPEVVWVPRERGGLLRGAQSRLARFDPGAPAVTRHREPGAALPVCGWGCWPTVVTDAAASPRPSGRQPSGHGGRRSSPGPHPAAPAGHRHAAGGRGCPSGPPVPSRRASCRRAKITRKGGPPARRTRWRKRHPCV